MKQISRQSQQSNVEIGSIARGPLSANRFTVLRNTQPVSIRAVYGPFSTKQTLPAHYIVADPIPVNSSGESVDRCRFGGLGREGRSDFGNDAPKWPLGSY